MHPARWGGREIHLPSTQALVAIKTTRYLRLCVAQHQLPKRLHNRMFARDGNASRQEESALDAGAANTCVPCHRCLDPLDASSAHGVRDWTGGGRPQDRGVQVDLLMELWEDEGLFDKF
jgi:hypothetical protein